MKDLTRRVIVYCIHYINRGIRLVAKSSTTYFFLLYVLKNNVIETNKFMGYIISTETLVGFLSIVFIGYILDKYHCTKKCLVFVNSCLVVGCSVYLIPIYQMPVIAKGIIGLSLGELVLINTDL